MQYLRNTEKTEKNSSVAGINPILSVITLSVNRLNSPIKRQRQGEWINKNQNPTVCYHQEAHFRFKDINILKIKVWEKTLCTEQTKDYWTDQTNNRQSRHENKSCLERAFCKNKMINPKRIYNNSKHIFISNNRGSKYLAQIQPELKGKIENSTVIVGDFNTPL